MAMSTTDVSDLVLAALETAIRQGGEHRLVTSGKKKGLLPRGARSAANKLAQDQCTDPNLALFTVRQVVEGKSKTAKPVAFVTITSRGIDVLFERKTSTEHRELLDRTADAHKEAAQEAVRRLSAIELKRIDEQRRTLDSQANELQEFIVDFVKQRLAELERQRRELDEQAKRLTRSTAEPPKPSTERPGRVPVPTTDEDLDYRRDVCRELVFAWQDNPAPGTRAALEVVMLNAGLDQVGQPGSQVVYTGIEHETTDAVDDGDLVTVVEPGWKLRSPRGTLLISRAKVVSAKP
jgi:hypothetical protein